jgi:iron complex transport system permease protein
MVAARTRAMVPRFTDRTGQGVFARTVAVVLALGGVLLVAAAVSVSMGPVQIPMGHVVSVLVSTFGIEVAEHTETERLVIEQLRLPRVVVATLVGAALGVAGTTMQALFRNPMADPGIIGVSAGGATGAVLSIAFGVHRAFGLALPLFSFLGAMAAASLVYGISSVGGRISMVTLLLAGVAVGAFLSAVVSAVVVLVPENEGLRQILFWLVGGLDSRSWEHVRVAGPFIGVGVLVSSLFARDLNLFMLGDDDARSLGVRVGLVRPVLITAATMATGAAVAVSGIIGFVGLVVPHMLRIVLGPDNRVLVPASALGGATFLLIADTVARTAVQPAELRVGIVTAFVGAPFFLFLLVRNKRRVVAL